jgi:NAD-dependent dihydropyrimidine dehydrogenase PreA subunit
MAPMSDTLQLPRSNAIAVDAIDALLPETQCAQCGYSGCLPYAEAIAHGKARINQCPPGGVAGIRALSALTGLPYAPLNPANGVHKPRTIALIDEAACIGCTICIQKCPIDAIVGSAKVMHTVLADEHRVRLWWRLSGRLRALIRRGDASGIAASRRAAAQAGCVTRPARYVSPGRAVKPRVGSRAPGRGGARSASANLKRGRHRGAGARPRPQRGRRPARLSDRRQSAGNLERFRAAGQTTRRAIARRSNC